MWDVFVRRVVDCSGSTNLVGTNLLGFDLWWGTVEYHLFISHSFGVLLRDGSFHFFVGCQHPCCTDLEYCSSLSPSLPPVGKGGQVEVVTLQVLVRFN